jgi:hypothetical protein
MCIREKCKYETGKGNAIPGLERPFGLLKVEVSRISRHTKKIRLSALYTGRLYPSGENHGT